MCEIFFQCFIVLLVRAYKKKTVEPPSSFSNKKINIFNIYDFKLQTAH